MSTVMQNCLIEFEFNSRVAYDDPFNQVVLQAAVLQPDGQNLTVNGFWCGGDLWKMRYSTSQLGLHKFSTVCSDSQNSGLHDQKGQFEVTSYTGDNPLYKHGPLRKSSNSTYLEHEDGKPFFWLADTWWMGLTKRLGWPDQFQELLQDRVDKGFNVVQIVAGLYPDMEWYDERGASEGGFPWDQEFNSINPGHFDSVDQKLSSLTEAGVLPCLVGCWGFYLDYAGEEVIRKHWDYLMARYGALPIMWCLGGEALMPFYKHPARKDPAINKEYEDRLRKKWTELTHYVINEDPFKRPVTIHSDRQKHDMVEDEGILDLKMLQMGHRSFCELPISVRMIRESINRQPRVPVINSEACYEGICGSSLHDVQRFLFWSNVLSGACGHTYGANGIWQINSREEPYGPSPHGATWGDTPWDEAYKFLGSKHVGLGKALLERYNWWEFEPHQEWVENSADEVEYIAPYAAGVSGKVRVIFIPGLAGLNWVELLVKDIEKGASYRAYYYDPLTGDEIDQGKVIPNADGNWRSGRVNKFQDWVLVLESMD